MGPAASRRSRHDEDVELEGTPVDVARLVRDARHAAKQTQASLAVRAGVSRGMVAAIETGARSPSWEVLSPTTPGTRVQRTT